MAATRLKFLFQARFSRKEDHATKVEETSVIKMVHMAGTLSWSVSMQVIVQILLNTHIDVVNLHLVVFKY